MIQFQFENLTGKFWCKINQKSDKYASIELSLKADGIKNISISKIEGVNVKYKR